MYTIKYQICKFLFGVAELNTVRVMILIDNESILSVMYQIYLSDNK